MDFLYNNVHLLEFLSSPDHFIYYYSERIALLNIFKNYKEFRRILEENLTVIEKPLNLDLEDSSKIVSQIMKIMPLKAVDSDDIFATTSLPELDIQLRRLETDYKTVELIILPEVLIHYLVQCDGKSVSAKNYRDKVREIFMNTNSSMHESLVTNSVPKTKQKKLSTEMIVVSQFK